MNPLFRSASLHQQVDQDGVVTTPFLNPDELQAIRNFYDTISPGGEVPQLRDGIHMTIWCADLDYKTHVRNELQRLLRPAAERMFDDCRLVTSVFIVKVPGEQTTFPIHQDWSVVDETRHTALNLWVPLQDVGAHNGGLWAVPGSHRLRNHVRGPGFLFPNLRGVEAPLGKLMRQVGGMAGTATIFYHRVIHGSPPNLSGSPRVALACSILPKDVPLHIYFQRDATSPLQVYHPPDDFIYGFSNVRDHTALRPPAGEAVAVLPPYQPATIVEQDVVDCIGMARATGTAQVPVVDSSLQRPGAFEMQVQIPVQSLEPKWRADIGTALSEARAQRRMVVLKAVGQGLDTQDNWCPAASHTRAVSLSDPHVSTLLASAFVTLRFSMQSFGHGADPAGISFVRDYTDPVARCLPPDLFVLSPEGEVLGRLSFDASPEKTFQFLSSMLQTHPDLAPAGDPLASHYYDFSQPAHKTLAGLQARWQAGERESLIEPLEDWLSQHDGWAHGAATATTMLGWAHQYAGHFVASHALMTEVMEKYTDHPIRHQARYSQLSAQNWVIGSNPFLANAPRPQLGVDFPVNSPFEPARKQRLKNLADDPRYVIPASGLPLARIPAGVFIMGGQPAMFPRELPLREVTISKPFLMAAWPVTRGLWRQFRPKAVPKSGDRLADDVPIAQITREDTLAFCEFLSQRDGLAYRLPTEAEWEYASRGGITGAPHPWGDQVPDPSLCNWEDSFGVPVASYPPNAYGLFEMVGNSREWTADVYLDDAYAKTPHQVTDPCVTEAAQVTLDRHDSITLYTLRGGVSGLPFCRQMMRCALRLPGREASIRLVVSLDSEIPASGDAAAQLASTAQGSDPLRGS